MPLPLNKRVKARAEEPADEYDDYESEDSSPSVIETGDVDGGEIFSSGDEDEQDEQDEQEEGEAAQERLANISFATLAKAQDSLSRKRKREADNAPKKDDKLEALRARLRELREQKGLSDSKPNKKSVSKDDSEDEDDDDDESGSESDDNGAPKSRSSKHAPGSQTSKRQVTRKRTVIDAPKRQVRDPRFGPMGGRNDEVSINKNYAFLNDYAESEMNELKAAIKKTKNEDDKYVLKQKLLSMESKKKAREAKERQQEVLREHRKKEKEAINQGKNPFYLKRSDQKQLAMVEKYNSMKGKDREKLMERRRKKVAGKEKKAMPQARRMVG